MESGKQIQPRFVRLRDAPGYLGMDRNRFNREVRPFLMEIPVGVQGVAFDRLDLDAWADEYKKCNGRPGDQLMKGDATWEQNDPQGCVKKERSGKSRSRSKATVSFEKALELISSKKPKDI